MEMDWSTLDHVAFSTGQKATGFVCLPSDDKLQPISLSKNANAFVLDSDPFAGKLSFKIKTYMDR